MCKRLCSWKISRLWRSVLLIYVITFMVVLPLVCSNLQNTLLDKLYARNTSVENARLLAINEARHNRSLGILKSLKDGGKFARLQRLLSGNGEVTPSISETEKVTTVFDGTAASTSQRKIDIVVTIITVSRTSKIRNGAKSNYLAQTLSTFIEILDTENVFEKFSVRLRVCNVDPLPQKYEDMNLVPDWIPVYQRFSSPQTPLELLVTDARLNKEKNDYVYCLDKSLQENTSYVLLVEDDAVPRKDLFSVMNTKIFEIYDHFKEIYPVTNNVTFIKLYHPERLLGYISIEPDRLMELFSISAILTMAVIYAYISWSGNRSEIPKSLWIVAFLFFIGIILIIGRANVIEFRRLSNHFYQISPAPSCCTPAMLFPRQGGQLVSDYLKTVECKAKFGKDSALDNLKTKQHLTTKLLVPNLFEHIGHFSSLRYELLNPFIIS